MSIIDELDGLFAIVLSLSIPIVAIVGAIIGAIQKKRSETELRKAIIENHVEAESIKLLIEEPKKNNNRFTMLRWGCILLGAGLGTACNAIIGLDFMSNIYFSLIIASGIGIGMLIAFVIETRMQKKSL